MSIPQDMQPYTIHPTNSCGDLEVIEYRRSTKVRVIFPESEYQVWTTADQIRKGKVKDPYCPSVHGVGFAGVGKFAPTSNGIVTKAYDTWKAMLGRCYCEKMLLRNTSYVGCSVVSTWHNLQNYAAWHEDNYIEGYQLDKDIKIKGNREYSPEACSFVSHAENTIEANAKVYALVSPTGKRVEVYNLSSFCKKEGLDDSSMIKVVKGKLKQSKGWTRGTK